MERIREAEHYDCHDLVNMIVEKMRISEEEAMSYMWMSVGEEMIRMYGNYEEGS